MRANFSAAPFLRILIFFFSFLILTLFSFDPDLGWHLAIGEHYLSTGEILKSDQFSWTIPGYVWGNSYFAYEVLVAFLVLNFGFVLTALVFGLMASIGILILLPAKLRIPDLIMAVIAAGLMNANLGVRPHTISFLFFAVLIRLLAGGLFSKRKGFFFWFLFFVMWANFPIIRQIFSLSSAAKSSHLTFIKPFLCRISPNRGFKSSIHEIIASKRVAHIITANFKRWG